MKTRLGIIFGSQSVEHEVSIITAVQLMKHIDRALYDVVPMYIDKRGRWLSGSKLGDIETFKDLEGVALLAEVMMPMPYILDSKSLLKNDETISFGSIDVAIICCHGTFGEDGTIQGLLELAGIPYQGPGVVGSAISMDKIITKKILEASSFNVANFVWLQKHDWEKDQKKELDRILNKENTGHKILHYPLFVKPANLGSSVGISKVTDKEELVTAIDIACSFDRRVLIEQGLENVIEVNVSVLGFQDYRASVPEQPISSGELLSYADKYERSGGKKSGGMASLHRRIPAPIPMALTSKLQEAAIHIARTCDLSGVIRIDFFVNSETNEFWVGEINTIPGSMAFYLWEASGMSYTDLINELVKIALLRKQVARSFTTSIHSTIIK